MRKESGGICSPVSFRLSILCAHAFDGFPNVPPSLATVSKQRALASCHCCDCLASSVRFGSATNVDRGLSFLADSHNCKNSGKVGGKLLFFRLPTAIPTCSTLKIRSSSDQHFFTSSMLEFAHISRNLLPYIAMNLANNRSIRL